MNEKVVLRDSTRMEREDLEVIRTELVVSVSEIAEEKPTGQIPVTEVVS